MKVIAWPAYKTRYKNPYNWLLYDHMPESVDVTEFSSKRLLFERFDVFHLHWPVETLVRHPNVWMACFRVLMFWALLKLSKWRGTKVIWTIHDEKPHVVLHQALADWFQAKLIANVDGYINLCAAGKVAVERAMPELKGKPGFVIPHGHYRGCYADDVSREEARSQLELTPGMTALLYLGYISPYKNVPHLIKTFRQLPEAGDRDVVLFVAGKPDNAEIEAVIRSSASMNENIRLHLRFIADDELQVFFKAADLVVLPFEEILNSGSLLLSLSFNRPVVVPNLGAVSDWKDRLGTDWIRAYDGALTPEVLLAAIAKDASELGETPLEFLDWEAIAQQTVQAYELLCNDPKEAKQPPVPPVFSVED